MYHIGLVIEMIMSLLSQCGDVFKFSRQIMIDCHMVVIFARDFSLFRVYHVIGNVMVRPTNHIFEMEIPTFGNL